MLVASQDGEVLQRFARTSISLKKMGTLANLRPIVLEKWRVPTQGPFFFFLSVGRSNPGPYTCWLYNRVPPLV